LLKKLRAGKHPEQNRSQHERYEVHKTPEAKPCHRRGERADGGVADYDELLREVVRVALRIDMNPAHDDWDDLYERIERLISAYIGSSEGEGEASCTLMARLAACVADVIPLAARRKLVQ
jgi:hypothetical protein